jgi:cytoskeleton protein RodZ
VGEFGEKFRKAREKKEMSLDDVSNVTKIGARMLRAIEEEDFEQLPGGVFNKGFIRAYAKHLGLNDAEAVNDYLDCLRQAQIDAHEVWEPQSPAPRPATPEKRRSVEASKSAVKSSSAVQVEELPELQLPRAEDARPPRKSFSANGEREIPWGIIAIASVVVVLGIILWMRRSHVTHTAAASTAKTQPATIAPALPPSVATSVPTSVPTAAAPALNRPFTPTPDRKSTTLNPPAISNSRPVRSSQSSLPTPVQTSVTVAPAISPAAPSPEKPAESDVTTRTVNQAPAARSSAKSDVPLKLVIRAEETSWISVQADGQTVSQETLIAPAHASIRASREIVARIGNAAGVTFLWNGQEIPAEGTEAEVKTFVFDANGMRVIPSTQSSVPGH